MVYIKGSNRQPIEMVRGNSEVFQVGIVINDQEYAPQSGEVVTFSMTRDVMDLNRTRYIYPPVLVKEIPINTLQLVLEPEDTAGLGFGTYVYDMKITFADGKEKTFIRPSPFVLTREV